MKMKLKIPKLMHCQNCQQKYQTQGKEENTLLKIHYIEEPSPTAPGIAANSHHIQHLCTYY